MFTRVLKMPVPKQPCQARQRKFGVIGKHALIFCVHQRFRCLDKIAPQESDDEDDRKPFPSGPNNARTSTVDGRPAIIDQKPIIFFQDPKNASGDQGKSTFKILLTATLFSVSNN